MCIEIKGRPYVNGQQHLWSGYLPFPELMMCAYPFPPPPRGSHHGGGRRKGLGPKKEREKKERERVSGTHTQNMSHIIMLKKSDNPIWIFISVIVKHSKTLMMMMQNVILKTFTSSTVMLSGQEAKKSWVFFLVHPVLLHVVRTWYTPLSFPPSF